MGRGEGPGRGYNNCHWRNPLTPTLSPAGEGELGHELGVTCFIHIGIELTAAL